MYKNYDTIQNVYNEKTNVKGGYFSENFLKWIVHKTHYLPTAIQIQALLIRVWQSHWQLTLQNGHDFNQKLKTCKRQPTLTSHLY